MVGFDQLNCGVQMSPNKIPEGTPCRTIDSNGSEVGNCLFLGLDIQLNRWHYHVLIDEKLEYLPVGYWTLIPLLFSEDVSS